MKTEEQIKEDLDFYDQCKQSRIANVIGSCDCLVGFISGEKVNKSTIDYQVTSIFNMMPQYQEYGMLKGKSLTKKEIVDNRRGYLSRFVYCPYCGEKVNWKQVFGNCL